MKTYHTKLQIQTFKSFHNSIRSDAIENGELSLEGRTSAFSCRHESL